MRKYYCILLLLPLLLTASCDRDDQIEIFPEEYFKVLYIKDSGERNITMNTAQDSVTEQMLVVKGGAHPEMEAQCRLEVMPAAEAAAQWGFSEGEFGIIPQDSYKLPESVSLTEDTPYKYLEVQLYPGKMASAMKEKAASSWILPLRLTSETASINRDNSLVLLTCSVVSPLIGWAKTGAQAVTIDYKTLSYPIELTITKTEINKVAFTGKIEALGEDAVAAFNEKHGTAYPLLPAGSYSLGEIAFAENELSGSATVNLSRTGLTADVEYLLPVRLTSVTSDLFELSDDVKYLIVGNPKFAFEEVDPASWKIAFSNSEDRNSEYWAMNMFNRDPGSNFCSYWNVTQQTRIGTDVDDFRYPVEGKYPGTCTYDSGRLAGTTIDVLYPCCDGVRKYDYVVVVIDLGETVNIHSIGLSKKAGSLGNLDLKGIEFYTEDRFTLETAAQYKGVDVAKYRAAIANYNTANEGNAWRLCMKWDDIPKGTTSEGLPAVWNVMPPESMNTPAAKGRYLKLRPTASYRANTNCIEICDIYIRKLITIDGEPAL
ncbi:MAG: DUF1735 domain-containing protein [Bacteroidales bacterium]|nr:DUF1735 domain-containing protein [Bacteroidales bacterium]